MPTGARCLQVHAAPAAAAEHAIVRVDPTHHQAIDADDPEGKEVLAIELFDLARKDRAVDRTHDFIDEKGMDQLKQHLVPPQSAMLMSGYKEAKKAAEAVEVVVA